MIFITVGTGRFEELVKEADRLVGSGKIKEKTIVQIGKGQYIPKNCEWFRFKPNLHDYYKKANLIISHGGTGTISEILKLKKKLIAVPNRKRTDTHQSEYLTAMVQETSAMIYCDRVDLLDVCLKKAKDHRFTPYAPPYCNIPEVICEFLETK